MPHGSYTLCLIFTFSLLWQPYFCVLDAQSQFGHYELDNLRIKHNGQYLRQENYVQTSTSVKGNNYLQIGTKLPAKTYQDPAPVDEKVSKEAPSKAPPVSSNVWKESVKAAFKGGLAGLLAGICQVLAFMWLRTIMNHQYARGGSMVVTAKSLYQEGGIMRFYQGVSIALIENPITRFGDTFANNGVMALLAGVPVHPMVKTIFTSLASASWRLAIMPMDTLKTVMQVQGDGAMDMLKEKVKNGGCLVLWTGAAASFAANWAGSYPWWATYNTLDSIWVESGDEYHKIVRSGVIGMCASIISDCISNSFRVIKTHSQANPDPDAGYRATLMKIHKVEGISGLLFRGLGTRLLCNVLQGTFFTIVWKCIERHGATH